MFGEKDTTVNENNINSLSSDLYTESKLGLFWKSCGCHELSCHGTNHMAHESHAAPGSLRERRRHREKHFQHVVMKS